MGTKSLVVGVKVFANGIRQRIRTKKGKHVGIMVAFKDDTGVRVGWSVCNVKKDSYDKVLGEKIAGNRASTGTDTTPPMFAVEQVVAFKARAEKYFNNPNPRPSKKKKAKAAKKR